MSLVEVAKLAAQAAEEKKAQNILVLDIRELSVFAEYFVICHGNSQTQVQAIVGHIKDRMNEAEVTIKGVEGFHEAVWVLVDLGDVIVHVFYRDERSFYDLERLWKEAPQIQ